MATDTILKLNKLTKTYILGNRKNAKKAQKAIQKLQKKYQHFVNNKDEQSAKKTEAVLQKAQAYFANEEYEKSYQTITGKHLKKRRRDRGTVVHALNGVDLEIKKGDLVAVMGPSGSGKSTLLNMLGMLDQPTLGGIFIDNQDVSAIKNRELPRIRSKQRS